MAVASAFPPCDDTVAAALTMACASSWMRLRCSTPWKVSA